MSVGRERAKGCDVLPAIISRRVKGSFRTIAPSSAVVVGDRNPRAVASLRVK